MTQDAITLRFGEYKNCLWVCCTTNFLNSADDRFVLLEGEECHEGTMYFCNTYLEAQFVMALEDGVGLYSDQYETDPSEPSFIVASKKPYLEKKAQTEKCCVTTQMTMSLNFGKYKHCLYGASTKNFIKEQDGRFILLEGESCTTGTMYFCNTYLEAQFVMALEDGVGLYSDECADSCEGYVVVSRKPFSFDY